jgi:hypothetical protein
MRKLYLLAAAASAVMAVPAWATATVSYNGTTYSSGQTINISFTGVQFPGSTGSLALTFTGTSGNDYDFTYSLTNTSTDPDTNISGFGFNVTGGTLDLSTSSATGPYDKISSGSISGGMSVDFCATGGSNCAGGSNSGPTPGNTATGTIALEFTTLPSSITFSQPVIRMQNTGPNGNGSDIGTPNALPEPGTWGLMLVGFGAMGFALRRRKVLLPQLA